MDSAYCMPGVVSKLFISTNSFRALKDPLRLVLLFSLLTDEETEAQGIVPGVPQELSVMLGFRILAPSP